MNYLQDKQGDVVSVSQSQTPLSQQHRGRRVYLAGMRGWAWIQKPGSSYTMATWWYLSEEWWGRGKQGEKIPPHHIHGLGVPDWRVVLFICRDNGGYKRTWADLPSLSVHEVRMGVLLRDHKVAFVFAGVCCHTRFRRGDDEGPL